MSYKEELDSFARAVEGENYIEYIQERLERHDGSPDVQDEFIEEILKRVPKVWSKDLPDKVQSKEKTEMNDAEVRAFKNICEDAGERYPPGYVMFTIKYARLWKRTVMERLDEKYDASELD